MFLNKIHFLPHQNQLPAFSAPQKSKSLKDNNPPIQSPENAGNRLIFAFKLITPPLPLLFLSYSPPISRLFRAYLEAAIRISGDCLRTYQNRQYIDYLQDKNESVNFKDDLD